MALAAIEARVFELAEMAEQGKRSGHGNPP
jgi:hypothetical protein